MYFFKSLFCVVLIVVLIQSNVADEESEHATEASALKSTDLVQLMLDSNKFYNSLTKVVTNEIEDLQEKVENVVKNDPFVTFLRAKNIPNDKIEDIIGKIIIDYATLVLDEVRDYLLQKIRKIVQ